MTYNLRQMTGCKSDGLVRQDLCEILYAATRAKQAGDSLLQIARLFDEDVYNSKDLTQWVSGAVQLLIYLRVFKFVSVDFTRRCLATPEGLGASNYPLCYHLFDSFLQSSRSGALLFAKMTVTRVQNHLHF